jgi:ketosteroid isomerase-like protein
MFGNQRHWPDVAVSVLVALAVGVGVGWHLHSPSANADESALSTARTEVDRFLQALSGQGSLDAVLGDAFQLMRADGRRYDRAAYLASPSSLTGYAVDELQAFEADGVLTATFNITLTGKVGGVERATLGLPRMTVFSKVDGAWKLQAYANLGQGLASGIDDAAKAAVETWVGTVAGGDDAAIRDLLAPEFQLVRSDGAAYDAVEYVAHDIPRIDAVLGIDDIVATAYGDHMVVRYAIDLKESVADGQIEGNAPRLTVFRRAGDEWLVVAHANFAQVEK